MAGVLDDKLKETVTDHSIYRAHAAKYEVRSQASYSATYFWEMSPPSCA